jgi:hypothetical protein
MLKISTNIMGATIQLYLMKSYYCSGWMVTVLLNGSICTEIKNMDVQGALCHAHAKIFQ